MKQAPYPAPNFSLPESVSGKNRSLADYKGKWLVLYFYPKDDTPGCTTEACSMRDARDALTSLGAEVVGISMDEPSAHEKFKSKFNLDFELLSDPDKVAIEAYGEDHPACGHSEQDRANGVYRALLSATEGGVEYIDADMTFVEKRVGGREQE